MGKNKVISELGNLIGNTAVHKILVKHTNRPESLPHLKGEVITYGNDAAEKAQEFNWNDSDKDKAYDAALKRFKSDMNKYYSDVEFSEDEAQGLIRDMIDEYM